MKLTSLFFLFSSIISMGQQLKVEGMITSPNHEVISFASISLEGTSSGVVANESGHYTFYLNPGTYSLKASAVGYKSVQKEVTISTKDIQLNFVLELDTQLDEVEVFGLRNDHPDKIEAITRLPLAPYEQIQSISVISEKVIEQQGNLTISDATKNVPGVYTFATYGNRSESMSSRGFRGIPILKNGVRVHSDFRGQGMITDMQGVDNIQVLKGAASITQGVATDLGSPGGVINIVTKTPKYIFGGQASVRAGSFGQVRPTFDVYGPIDEQENLAFRINGALEQADSYRSGISSQKMYINPSFQWKIDDKTKLTLEMDYLDDSRTPDLGTLNLADNDTNAIYDLPHSQYLGFTDDKNITENFTYSIRFNRNLNEKLSLQAAFYSSKLNFDGKRASLGSVVEDDNGNPIYNQRVRGYNISTRSDNNSVLQLDLIGDAVKIGSLEHTFQVGMDYRTTKFDTYSQSASTVDIIDVFSSIDHTLPNNLDFNDPSINGAKTRSIGFVAQDVIKFNSWLKSFFGLRISTTETITDSKTTSSNAVNPLIGIITEPFKNVNVFASYTNSSYPRTATRLDVNGDELGNERFDQFEAGVKAHWFNNRLRFNLTFFKINNKNINLPVYDENWDATGYYEKGGNDQRQGIEVELTGRLFENLEIITGYSYIDAQYKEHTSYVYGSSPLNTPKHTFNVYGNYLFTQKLEGLSVGAGVYYTGERPINDWSSGAVTHQGIVPNQKPFYVDAYTQVNAQIAYRLNKNWNARIIANNIFDSIGYNAYRTAYINQTDPFNISGVLTYSF